MLLGVAEISGGRSGQCSCRQARHRQEHAIDIAVDRSAQQTYRAPGSDTKAVINRFAAPQEAVDVY
jgi:hypothetical protein